MEEQTTVAVQKPLPPSPESLMPQSQQPIIVYQTPKIGMLESSAKTAGTAFLAGLFGVTGAWIANVSIHAGVNLWKEWKKG